MAGQYFVDRSVEGGWNPEGYRQWLMTHFPITFEVDAFASEYLSIEEIEIKAIEKVLEAFRQKFTREENAVITTQKMMNTEAGPDFDPGAIVREIIRNLLTRNIDRLWQEHLLHIDHLRTEVNLHSIAQKDPLLEFKHQAFALFDTLSREIKTEIAHALFKFHMVIPEAPTVELPQKKENQGKKNKKNIGRKVPSPLIDLSLLDEEGDLISK